MRTMIKSLLAFITALAVSGCMNMPQDGRNSLATTTSLAYFPKKTQTQSLLNQMPAPQRQVAIAVYGFTDQTGQFKPSDVGQTLSRAVTQGASAMLVKALQDTGNRIAAAIQQIRKSLRGNRHPSRGNCPFDRIAHASIGAGWPAGGHRADHAAHRTFLYARLGP